MSSARPRRALEAVGAVAVELASTAGSKAIAISAPGLEPRRLDRLQEQLQRLGAGRERRGEPALVADAGRQALVLQQAVERVEALGAPSQPSENDAAPTARA